MENETVFKLKEGPTISGLTDKFSKLTDEDWKYALTNLRTYGLVAKKNLNLQNYWIANLGAMGLHLIDYHLELGNLCIAEENIDEARHHFRISKEMIENMGYHRRDNKLKYL